MPWEMEHSLIIADKLKHSIYYINSNDTIYLDTALNLSSFLIDWENSKLPKDFFIEKYNLFCKIVNDKFIHKSFIYEGNDLYGHLDLHKTTIQPDIDYYVTLCPDIDFSNELLYYLIESAKLINTEYFVLTPQIFKCWDNTWDFLVNDIFHKYDYKDCIDINIHDIRFQIKNTSLTPELQKINSFKYAGWFDLYNKNYYEKLVPVLDEWKGYGPWDFYGMSIASLAKNYNVDVSQYILKNEIIWFYDTGILRNMEEYGGYGSLKQMYLKFIKKTTNKKTESIDTNNKMQYYIDNWIKYAKNSNIIK